MTLSITKWTIDDYHRLIESGFLTDRPVELLNGMIVNMAPEGTSHAYFSDRFANQLRRRLGDRAQIREAKPITLPNDSEPEPDIAVVRSLDAVYLNHHPYPDDIFWVIEYANSSLNKDLDIKSQVYAAAAIEEYWVVDLKHQQLVVFRSPKDGVYQQQITLKSGAIAPLAFEDCAIEVGQLGRQ